MSPVSIRLEASTRCQLKCPSCPTAQGKTQQFLGSGTLTLERFEQIIDQNPTLMHVELSNWGEIFLNPELIDILRVSYEKNIMLTASNGVNLNTVKPEVLEALVKYKFRHLDCSIDGASQETYQQYRVGGNFHQVIENIKLINHYKAQYKSQFPLLLWQFVVFGHNEHELETARAMAAQLGMDFYVKLSWDEKISPVKDTEHVRSQTASGAVSRSEYEQEKGSYIYKSMCQQLWTNPQINWDGRLLGCCFNYWGDFGNVLSDPGSFAGEAITYAKAMLKGEAAPKDGIPCTTCKFFKAMQERGSWMKQADLRGPLASPVVLFLVRWLGRPFVWLMNRSEPLALLALKPAIVSNNKKLRN